MRLAYFLLAAVLACLFHPTEGGSTHSSLRRLSGASTPEAKCFESTRELRRAVDAYLDDPSNETDVAVTYGWPIGTWCVDAVENFNALFSRGRNRRAASFNEDISGWNISQATSMRRMFLLASDFDQDLCAWGDLLDAETTSFGPFMFSGTSCPTTQSPAGNVDPAGPFCNVCIDRGPTTSPSETPTISPSATPSTCFRNNGELRDAVSLYLADNSRDTEVAREYGWPIGSWCVDEVENFDSIFDQAHRFNEDISQWNVSKSTSMYRMFYNASSFNQPIGAWDVSKVTTMDSMFYRASNFNQPIGAWDVSKVTSMKYMFTLAFRFNQQIGEWDVSNVSTMLGMFLFAGSFNQPIEDWDVSNVRVMEVMFAAASNFNQRIGAWNVSQASNIGQMFNQALRFNQPLDEWDVSKVGSMFNMFFRARSFNQSLAGWNMSNVTSLSRMFQNASSFNQPIEAWDVSNVRTMDDMFFGASSFNQSLEAWDVSSVNKMDRMFLEASSFNQPLGVWNVSNLVGSGTEAMFSGASAFAQNLCPWGEHLRVSHPDMFLGTSCPTTDGPNLTASPPGPLCYTC